MKIYCDEHGNDYSIEKGCPYCKEDDAQEEIEKLKAENAAKSIQISGMESEINRLTYELDKSRDSHMKIITKLTKQNEIMKKALIQITKFVGGCSGLKIEAQIALQESEGVK